MSSDYVALKGMQFHGLHGVHPFEKENGNTFTVDAIFYADLNQAGATDDLSHTINYGEAYKLISEVMNGPSKNLLEALLEDMAGKLLAAFPEIKKLTLTIRKLQPPVGGLCEASEIQRSWNNA